MWLLLAEVDSNGGWIITGAIGLMGLFVNLSIKHAISVAKAQIIEKVEREFADEKTVLAQFKTHHREIESLKKIAHSHDQRIAELERQRRSEKS